MKMKICPCCDQPIEGIYCKGCRKIVLKPMEREVNYYLNTRHPDFEHACTYHDGEVRQSTTRMTAGEAEEKKKEIRARMAQRKPAKPEVGANLAQARKRLITMVTALIAICMIVFTFAMINIINWLNAVIRF